MESSVSLGITNIGIGALILALCIPLYFRKISMNPFYGFRFERSMESPELWYQINQFGARSMIAWALALVALGIILVLNPIQRNSFLYWIALMAPLVLLIPAIQAYRFAQRLPPTGKIG